MSKYALLNQYLLTSDQNCITLHFRDVEQLIGISLPKSAYTHRAWWANGNHPQAKAWLNAGYKVESVNLLDKGVAFCKNHSFVPIKKSAQKQFERAQPSLSHKSKPVEPNSVTNSMTVCGYEFHFIQKLTPKCDAQGNVVKHYPQESYENKNGLSLSRHGKGAFCRFSIDADDIPGVYLWLLDDQIIYIGETAGLRRRFNTGYGSISPRNCYVSGQSTNCKMNKVVLDCYERGQTVNLYFHHTIDYKQVELELLKKLSTPYNIKDNLGQC